MVYLDYAAGCPVKKEVLDCFYDVSLKYFANPNSSHKLGLEAKNVIDEATSDIAKILGVKSDEIIYTSGASESNNLVIKGIASRYRNRGRHILISSLEHNSIVSSATKLQESGFEVEIIPVLPDGLIDIESLKDMIRDDTILVSVCSVDSELGIRQPIEKIASIIKEYPNCYFHTDATQAIGKVMIDYSLVDLITITPHKFYGLSGIGILIKRSNVSITAQIDGGKSTTIYRSGTPNLALIVSSAKALQLAYDEEKSSYDYILKLNNIIKNGLVKYKRVHINSTANSINNIINFSVKGIRAIDLERRLESYSIYVSTKTSCCPIETPSKLVYALTRDKSLSSSSIRLSISSFTTLDDVLEFLRVFDIIYREYDSNGEI